MKREAAWRVFAGEYNDSNVEVKGDGEKTPSYVITPLGAKINRLFIIGVLTDVENVSEDGDLVRSHISDPTGVFTLYSGQYQQSVTDALKDIEVPAFVAIVGKAKTYTPEEGTIYVSVRPENIVEVDANVRDRWILETCKSTKERIEAVVEAKKMEPSNTADLEKIGYTNALSEGVITALKNYEDVDLNKYIALIHESLQYLTPGENSLPDISSKSKKTEKKVKKELNDAGSATGAEVKEDNARFEEIEKTVLETIKKIEGNDGAAWDSITEKCEKTGLDHDSIEEALTSLMDKGLIYEPILGTIKTT